MTALLIGLAGQIIIPAAGIGALAVIARSLAEWRCRHGRAAPRTQAMKPPQGCALQPAVFAVCCLTGAALWVGGFQIIAALCCAMP